MGLKSPIPLQDLKFNVPVPYTLSVDRELLESTKQKLALARYPEEQTDFGESNWAQGAKVSRVKQLAEVMATLPSMRSRITLGAHGGTTDTQDAFVISPVISIPTVLP